MVGLKEAPRQEPFSDVANEDIRATLIRFEQSENPAKHGPFSRTVGKPIEVIAEIVRIDPYYMSRLIEYVVRNHTVGYESVRKEGGSTRLYGFSPDGLYALLALAAVFQERTEDLSHYLAHLPWYDRKTGRSLEEETRERLGKAHYIADEIHVPQIKIRANKSR